MTSTVAQRTTRPVPVPTHGSPGLAGGGVLVLAALAALLTATAAGVWVGLARPSAVLLAGAAVMAAFGGTVLTAVAVTYFRRPEPSRHL